MKDWVNPPACSQSKRPEVASLLGNSMRKQTPGPRSTSASLLGNKSGAGTGSTGQPVAKANAGTKVDRPACLVRNQALGPRSTGQPVAKANAGTKRPPSLFGKKSGAGTKVNRPACSQRKRRDRARRRPACLATNQAPGPTGQPVANAGTKVDRPACLVRNPASLLGNKSGGGTEVNQTARSHGTEVPAWQQMRRRDRDQLA